MVEAIYAMSNVGRDVKLNEEVEYNTAEPSNSESGNMTTTTRSCLKDEHQDKNLKKQQQQQQRQQQQQQGQRADVEDLVDLETLMSSVDQLFVLASPYFTAFRICQKICRWELPTLCIVLLVVINGTCLLPVGYQLLMAWTLLAGLGSLGYLHMRTGALVKVFPNPDNIVDSDALSMDPQEETDGHIKLMHRFKTLLLYINTVVKWTCCFLSTFYAVLKWENSRLSICVYVVVFIEIGSLYLLPLRWNLLLLLDVILLYIPTKRYIDKTYTHVMEGYRARLQNQERTVNQAVTPDPDTISLSQVSSASSEPVYDKDSETDNSEKLEEGSSDYSESDLLEGSEVKDSEVKRAGVMGRIRELKKKRQAAAVRCTGCEVAFTAILKRRHVCTYCGYQYCSKCCSQRVPKKLFGATSPSAQTDTVLVCQQCHIFLTGKTTRDPASPLPSTSS